MNSDEAPTPKLSEGALAILGMASVTADRLRAAARIYESGPVYSTPSAMRCHALAAQLSELADWVSELREHGASEAQKARERESMMRLVEEAAPLLGRVGEWL